MIIGYFPTHSYDMGGYDKTLRTTTMNLNAAELKVMPLKGLGTVLPDGQVRPFKGERFSLVL